MRPSTFATLMVIVAIFLLTISGFVATSRDAFAQSPDQAPKKDASPGNESGHSLKHPIVVRHAIEVLPKSLDPMFAGDVASSVQCGMVYEQLFEYDYFATPPRVVSCLASALPILSPDDLEWTIQIRKGVLFQDDACFPDGKGRELTAHDVIWSLKRMNIHPKSTGTWLLENKVHGLDELRELCAKASKEQPELSDSELMALVSAFADKNIDGLLAVNDHTVKIRLKTRYPELLFALCMSYSAPVAREAVAHYAELFADHPVGTGPFRLKGGTLDREATTIVWERSPSYRVVRMPKPTRPIKIGDTIIPISTFEPYIGKQLPLADQISYAIVPDRSVMWQDFLNGSSDHFTLGAMEWREGVADPETPLSKLIAAKGLVLCSPQRSVVEYITFNMDDPEIGTAGGENAKAIRKAFATGLNAKKYLADFNPFGTPAKSWLPESFAAFDHGYTNPYAHGNLDAARKLLTDVGYSISHDEANNTWTALDSDGKQPKLTILLRGTTQSSSDRAMFFLETGKAIGIDVHPVLQTFPDFLRSMYRGRGQSYNAGWVLDFPASSNILMLFIEPEARPNGLNSARWRNAEATKLFDELSSINPLDDNAANLEKSIATRFMKLMDEDCPGFPIYVMKSNVLRHSWTLPIVHNDFNYGLGKYMYTDPIARETWLDEQKRAAEEPHKSE